jgi:hypothetical protein
VRDQIEKLEDEKYAQERIVMARLKTVSAIALIPAMLIFVFVTAWLGKENPLKETPWMVTIGVGILFVFTYLIQMAMLLRVKLKFNTELSEKKARLAAIVGGVKK